MDESSDGTIALLVTTVAAEADAARLARVLVEEGLAACVTRLPGAHSVYRWQGQVEEASEIVLVVKTTPERLDEARAYLVSAHPYALPELLVCEDIQAAAPYAAWVRDNVRSTPSL